MIYRGGCSITHMLSICVTTCWQTNLFSATVFPGHTTASHIDVSWNRLNSDFSPQNSLKAAASGSVAAGPLSKILVENSVLSSKPKVSVPSVDDGGGDVIAH